MAEDLYKEVTCRRCGQKRLAVASFCPHCGDVVRESWITKITKLLRNDSGEAPVGFRGRNFVPVLLAIAAAGYFLYVAIEQESLQGALVALLSIIFVIRSIVSRPNHPTGGDETRSTAPREADSSGDDVPEDKFFCENCGTAVAADAAQCPKCGMRFG